MDRERRLIARWYCLTRSPRYLDWRILMGIYRFEQHAVVGPARIVHAFEVNYACFDKTAKREKMMPVAPVSCEA
jgi:hypothetical protein